MQTNFISSIIQSTEQTQLNLWMQNSDTQGWLCILFCLMPKSVRYMSDLSPESTTMHFLRIRVVSYNHKTANLENLKFVPTITRNNIVSHPKNVPHSILKWRL